MTGTLLTSSVVALGHGVLVLKAWLLLALQQLIDEIDVGEEHMKALDLGLGGS